MELKKSRILALLLSAFAFAITVQTPVHAALNSVDYAMYFHSEVKDSEECRMSVENGEIVTPGVLRNLSMTCPDMFSWQLFTEVVRDQFWTNWADETQNWPAVPYPLCADPEKPGENCCTPNHPDKNPAGHCPVFPLDLARAQTSAKLLKAEPEARIGRPSIMAHHNPAMPFDATLLEERLIKKIRQPKLKEGETPACAAVGVTPADIITQKTISESESIGRIVRQTNAEITVRNRSFHYYLFRNNLYNADGVAEAFLRHSQNLQKNAPYRSLNGYTSKDATSALSKIDLPADAIMIKSNWLHEGLAKQLGIQDTPETGFIKKHLITPISYGDNKTCNLEGTHYLMAFHISSKDIPKWVWTTFEHIQMPGRCDITGCNDSYGYRNPNPNLPKNVADNYIAPKTKSDNLNSPSVVFDRDSIYPPEPIRAGLESVLDDLSIGIKPSVNPKEPTPQDLAWRNYRLKGSQVDFVDSTGRSNLLGNSITEAGFMDGSSCITCHARAGIKVTPMPKDKTLACSESQSVLNGKYCYTFFGLGVFENNLSEFGYARSAHGIPNPDWYYANATPPALNILPVDFIWGFLFASPLVK
ncbi:hypothetical protein [Nitrosococcus wardiae]|uniref:Cytochrome C n=1 Tax=Nitrosococcus wardiae TaxID=1814290 RepID=A0A4P7C146_9GAMM|nr:hypothetical protein [Nitrosococcus wardiae]QBQ56101.1 hypothetical protein E3U44_17480 [Nitrosococcus wardiae]